MAREAKAPRLHEAPHELALAHELAVADADAEGVDVDDAGVEVVEDVDEAGFVLDAHRETPACA